MLLIKSIYHAIRFVSRIRSVSLDVRQKIIWIDWCWLTDFIQLSYFFRQHLPICSFKIIRNLFWRSDSNDY